MANISRKNGGLLHPITPSDTRAEPQCESRDILLAGVQPEDDLHGGESRTNAHKRRVGLKSWVGEHIVIAL